MPTPTNCTSPLAPNPKRTGRPLVPCWLTYTNRRNRTRIIHCQFRRVRRCTAVSSKAQARATAPRSRIRSCALQRQKPRISCFIEPEGLKTTEEYVRPRPLLQSARGNPISNFMRTIPGLEKAEIMRPAYAIEYDCVDPLQFDNALH